MAIQKSDMLLRDSVVKFTYTDSFIVGAAVPNQFSNPTFVHKVFYANSPTNVEVSSSGAWTSQTQALTTCPGVTDWVADNGGSGGKYREGSCFASSITVSVMPLDNGQLDIQELCKLIVHCGTSNIDWGAVYTTSNNTDTHCKMPLTMTKFVKTSAHMDYKGATLKMNYAFKKMNAGSNVIQNTFHNNTTPNEKDFFYVGLLPMNVTEYLSNTQSTPKCLINITIDYICKLTEPQADESGLLGETAIISRRKRKIF